MTAMGCTGYGSPEVLQGALTALFFLRKGQIEIGNGFSFPVIAEMLVPVRYSLSKHFSADVSGVHRTAKLELVKSLGAD